MALVKFVGGGEDEMIEVAWIGDYPKGPSGSCAYCDGDPCNERSPKDSRIAKFYERFPDAETCPCCDGRPS